MRLSIIAAVATNGVIGHQGRLPWHLPADLARFKELTTGHALIMGRKTFESIGRALPGRRSVVLTSDGGYRAQGVTLAASLAGAVEACAGEQEAFVIGGASVYAEALAVAGRAYITRVDSAPEGDTFFPDTDLAGWTLVDETLRASDEENAYPMTFCTYERG